MTREEAIKEIEDRVQTTEYIGGNYVDCVDIEALRMAVSALQQPEIVRCKDCTRFDERRGCNLVEGLNIAKPDSYCSYAERKEGEA